MSATRRWTKWWWQDWQRDPALRMCSPAARGIWMDMLAIMHDAEPCGHLLVNGKKPTPRQLASVCGTTEKDVLSAIEELEDAGVFSRSEGGAIVSRRMVRDKAAHDEGVKNGKTGGNPKLKEGDKPKRTRTKKQDKTASCEAGYGGGLTPPFNNQEAEADTDISSSLRSEETGEIALSASDASVPKSSKVPLPSWLPSAPWAGYLEMRKKIRKPASPRAVELLLKKLEAWHHGGEDIGEILDRSTRRSWTDVFLPDRPGSGRTSDRGLSSRPRTAAQNADENARFLMDRMGVSR